MNQKDKDKLVKSLNLLSSEHDGEVLGAAKAAIRILNKNDTSFCSIVNGHPATSYASGRQATPERDMRDAYENLDYKRSEWRGVATLILSSYSILTAWEQMFINTIVDRRMTTLTDNQWKVLHRIARKVKA